MNTDLKYSTIDSVIVVLFLIAYVLPIVIISFTDIKILSPIITSLIIVASSILIIKIGNLSNDFNNHSKYRRITSIMLLKSRFLRACIFIITILFIIGSFIAVLFNDRALDYLILSPIVFLVSIVFFLSVGIRFFTNAQPDIYIDSDTIILKNPYSGKDNLLENEKIEDIEKKYFRLILTDTHGDEYILWMYKPGKLKKHIIANRI